MRSDRGPWKDPNILKVGSYLKLSAVLLYFETLFHFFFFIELFSYILVLYDYLPVSRWFIVAKHYIPDK